MEIRKHLMLTLFSAFLLSGCTNDTSVAYWTDSSYKSPMDYDAMQKTEIEDELALVRSGVNDILSSTPEDVTGKDHEEVQPTASPNS